MTRLEEIRERVVAGTNGPKAGENAMIRHAREDLPFLLSEVERLERRNSILKMNSPELDAVLDGRDSCIERLQRDKEMLLRVAVCVGRGWTIETDEVSSAIKTCRDAGLLKGGDAE